MVDGLTVGEALDFGYRESGRAECEYDRAERVIDAVDEHDASVRRNVPAPMRARFRWFGV